MIVRARGMGNEEDDDDGKTRKMSHVFKSNPNKGLIRNHLGDQTITGMKGGKSGTVETTEFLGLKVGEIGEIGEI